MMARAVAIGLLIVGSALAQTLVEHAAAAAGGSVGGVAGKQVGRGIDSVFKRTAATVEKVERRPAAKAKLTKTRVPVSALRREPPNSPTPLPRIAAVRPTPLPKAKPVRASRSAKSLIQTVTPPEAARTVLVGGQCPAELIVTRMALIEGGMNRQQVLAQLGKPSFVVSVAGESGVVEILRYRSGRRDLGSVRLANGVVEEVQAVH